MSYGTEERDKEDMTILVVSVSITYVISFISVMIKC